MQRINTLSLSRAMSMFVPWAYVDPTGVALAASGRLSSQHSGLIESLRAPDKAARVLVDWDVSARELHMGRACDSNPIQSKPCAAGLPTSPAHMLET